MTDCAVATAAGRSRPSNASRARLAAGAAAAAVGVGRRRRGRFITGGCSGTRVLTTAARGCRAIVLRTLLASDPPGGVVCGVAAVGASDWR